MDSTQLERDALEGKDRDELTTIATALGGKPGSRARKAEIVDLILDLTGGGSSANGAAAPKGEEPESVSEPEQADEPPAAWETEIA